MKKRKLSDGKGQVDKILESFLTRINCVVGGDDYFLTRMALEVHTRVH
jgi:hypothetical protein